MRELEPRGGSPLQALDRRRVVGPLEEKLRQLARLGRVVDALHEHLALERRHRGVAVQLQRALIRLETELVAPERVGELPGAKSGVALLAPAMRRLPRAHLRGVPPVDVGLHRLERGVLRRVLHPRVVLVVGWRPQVPRVVVRRPALFLGHLGAVLVERLARAFASLLLRDHLVHLGLDLLLLLRAEVLVLAPLRLLGLFLPLLLELRALGVALLDLPIHVLGRDLARPEPVYERVDLVHVLEKFVRVLRRPGGKTTPPGAHPDALERLRHRSLAWPPVD